MNVRQKLSLAALSIALPVLASAQAAAPAAAPALEIKPYGFALLTMNQSDGTWAYPEYPGPKGATAASSAGHYNHFSARQSRFGVNVANADGGVTGAKLGGKFEFDFMGPAGSSWDSAVPRLRYFYGQANWDCAALGKFTVTVGQTDGLVVPLHPELGAYIALPTFMQSGNLTRRSPQLRGGWAMNAGPLALTVEAAALNAADGGGVANSAGNASGQPDYEARVQGKFSAGDISATVGVAGHINERVYNARAATQQNLTSTLIGVDANVDATKYVNVRGEWYTSEGGEESYSGAFTGTNGAAGSLELKKSTGFWAQAVVKPLPILWIMGGFGQSKLDGVGGADDTTNTMMNVGVLSNVSKNWRLGLEYTTVKVDFGPTDVKGSELALSSRFSF
jgi:hypothetical protein